MLSYPVRLIPTREGTVRAMFPDVPEATAEGGTEDDALNRAKFALELALGHRLHSERKIPPPSDICGAPTVETDKFIIQETAAGGPAPISGGRY
ncbi:MAG: type II toxin-antitoxin system HicB family antitoxin [Pseudomonadota bacterium]|nr:type II toxin-antitoxin system HicB family antitoxin [Pseudomonadota bacterium]